MKGTEKQIAWAEDIRQEKIDRLIEIAGEELAAEIMNGQDSRHKNSRIILAIDDAAFWIETRGRSISQLANDWGHLVKRARSYRASQGHKHPGIYWMPDSFLV